MKVGIIGAGQIGGTLTRRLSALGHEVSVANSRGPETLTDLAAETGATGLLRSIIDFVAEHTPELCARPNDRHIALRLRSSIRADNRRA
jgi:predicted dinucleotide-binding enzyme